MSKLDKMTQYVHFSFLNELYLTHFILKCRCVESRRSTLSVDAFYLERSSPI